MTGKFTVETKDTGSNTEFKIVGGDGSSSKALDFLDLKTKCKQCSTKDENFCR